MVSTLFLHGAIRSLESETAVHEAMLVENGRIVALGSEGELRGIAPAGTETVELDGGVVLPGFHDAHFHIGNLARELEAPDLRGAASLGETLDRLRAWADAHPGDGWVLGGRWDRNLWPAGEMPTRQALDALFGSRPVSLPSVDGHAVWANTAGLRAAGIDAGTPDPVGGRIEREPGSQEPTGLLLEAAGDDIRDRSEAGGGGGAAPPPAAADATRDPGTRDRVDRGRADRARDRRAAADDRGRTPAS
jgi:predicted amidohydrolase YtcJ